jgi:hypothetical protein
MTVLRDLLNVRVAVDHYAQVNDFIEQLKILVLNDPRMSVVSGDVHTDNLTGRVLELKHEYCSHKLKITAYSTATVTFQSIHTDGIKVLASTTMKSLLNKRAIVLYGDNCHTIHMIYGREESHSICFINNSTTDTQGPTWAIGTFTNGSGTWFTYPNNGKAVVYSPSYGDLNGDGSVPLIPAVIGRDMEQQVCPALFSLNSSFNIARDVVYTDTSDINYLCLGGYWFVCDN